MKLYYDSNDSDDTLMDCPFCASEAHLEFVSGCNMTYFTKDGFDSTPFLYHVICDRCHASTGPCKSPEVAIEFWNRRV